MSLQELLNQMDFGSDDPTERQHRLDQAQDALRTGHMVRGWIGPAIVTIERTIEGSYFVTKRWVIRDSEVQP